MMAEQAWKDDAEYHRLTNCPYCGIERHDGRTGLVRRFKCGTTLLGQTETCRIGQLEAENAALKSSLSAYQRAESWRDSIEGYRS